jgi:outer membrane protein assembly factor BamE (lipoprotein component of BamABCDE complex)
MKKILVLVLLWGLSGCAFVSQNFNANEYQGLKNGMSREEVKSALGEPHKQNTLMIEGKQYEAWEYPVSEPQKIKYNRLGDTYYKVFFLEGKVSRWDKDKVFAQPDFGFHESAAPEQKVTIIKTTVYKEVGTQNQTSAAGQETPKAKVAEPVENLK